MLLLLALSCSGFRPSPVWVPRPSPRAGGLVVRLFEASPPPGGHESAPRAEGAPLPAEALAALLGRLPPLPEEAARPVALRPGPTPPPRPGAEVRPTFPVAAPPPAPPATDPGPPRVVRHSPEGEVPFATSASVTFDRPMVPIATVDVVAGQVPATLSPTPEGSWRWVGTRTLLFDAGERLPMATRYEVEVPDLLRFTFATPPPTLLASWAGGDAFAPTVLLRFDQRVDPAAVLDHLRVSGTGGVRLRLATDQERDRALGEGRWTLGEGVVEGSLVALRPVEPLPPGARVTLTVRAGTPSAEGPRTTARPQRAGLATPEPLRLRPRSCGVFRRCGPSEGLYVFANNELDPGTFDPAAWTVAPAVDGLTLVPNGRVVWLQGDLRPRTRYRVTAPAGLTDVYGQSLGRDRRVVVPSGRPSATVELPGRDLLVLDPGSGGRLPLWTVGEREVEVEVREVAPADWDAWWTWRWRPYDEPPPPPPGREVFAGTLVIDGERHARQETLLDLSPFLGQDGVGHLLVGARPVGEERFQQRWVEATDLGVAAFADGARLVAWVSELSTGAPASGVTVSLLGRSGEAVTGAEGLAELPLPSSDPWHPALVARRGADVALLPEHPSGGSREAWERSVAPERLRWYVAEDRGLYRPGETARIKGWIRRDAIAPEGDLEPLREPTAATVAWDLEGARGRRIAEGTAPVSAHGGFDLAIALPEDVDLGDATLELSTVDGGTASTTWSRLRIEEFRRPEFEVEAAVAEGPLVVGGSARVDLRARYYAGGGLRGAEVSWWVEGRPGTYAPPGLPGFHFGPWAPSWGWRASVDDAAPAPTGELQGLTDDRGEHHLGLELVSVSPIRPTDLVIQGTVVDVNRQAWTVTERAVVHPAEVYVGLRSDRGFVRTGEAVEVDLAVVDLDGGPALGARLEVALVRVAGGEAEVGQCAVTLGAGARGRASCPTAGAGEHRVRARVTDAKGRPNESELGVWVAGGAPTPSAEVVEGALTLIPEREVLADGDVARVLVEAPFAPAEGTYTVRRDGLERVVRFRAEGRSTTLEVPVDDTLVPGFDLHVHLVGPRMAHASGSVPFRVPPARRTLGVEVAAAEGVIEPGAGTRLDVVVRDPDGAPVADAEVVVVAADEAVLALAGYHLPDPLEVFYTARVPGVTDHLLRWFGVRSTGALDLAAVASSPSVEVLASVPLGRSYQSAVTLARGVTSAGGNPNIGGRAYNVNTYMLDGAYLREDAGAVTYRPARPAPITVRTDLGALALFAPEVRTDAEGHARVPLELPDSLTRYRVMVVAADHRRSFGSAETTVTATKALMVRPSPPRFLNFGDRAELPVVVQNTTSAPLTVDVAVRATNLDLDRSGVAGRRVVVPANDRIEVRFPATTRSAGIARLQVVAVAEGLADAADLALPVWTPATTEAVATYGSLDAGVAVQPVEAPRDVWAEVGGLEVATSSTELQALTDAVLYLQRYPYECSEQLASRVLAVVSLRDVLSAFGSGELPPAAVLDAGVRADLRRLAERQGWDGGWSFWGGEEESWPYLSIHVANAIARAADRGFRVPDETRAAAVRYLRGVEHDGRAGASSGFLRAYALDTLRRLGQPDRPAAVRLYERSGEVLGVDALALLLPTLRGTPEADAILEALHQRVVETAGAAHFVTAYEDGAHVLLHSEHRADALVLEALLETTPGDDLVEKVARGLLAARTNGRWSTTNENAAVLLALDRYFRVREGETPDFVARTWLGDAFLGEHAFRGRTTERALVEVPMADLASGPLTVAMDGDAGRLYYRIGLRYAPRDLRLEPTDQGFAVTRRYVAVDDSADVTRDADGTWRVRAGARVRVELALSAEARRSHVALVDPLPAGLEPLNPTSPSPRGRRRRRVAGPGTTTTSSATTGPRCSRRSCGPASTSTRGSAARRPPAASSFPRRRPRRCTRPRPSAGPRATW